MLLQLVDGSKVSSNKTKQNETRRDETNMAPRYLKVDFAWKRRLLFLFLNGKAYTLNKTNKTYTVEWNFQAVSVS
jgi:hypothetical protein